jgi:glutathione S-transferase
MTTPITIYGVPFSVHTRKVILTARIKSIPFEIVPVVPVIPDNPPADWRAISPTGLIPAIDDGGYRLADSTAIVHYLERRTPEPALLPADPRALGRALFLDAWAGSALFRRVVHPIFFNQVVGPKIRKAEADAAALEAALTIDAPEAFAYLESLAPERFFVGDALTVADLAVVSNLLVFHYLGHRVDGSRHPKLAAYFRRALELAPVAAAVAAERPFVEQMELDRSFLAAIS